MNEVVRWDEELARSAKEVASRERPNVSQIGLRAGVMMYRGMQVPDNKLKCIIVASAVERRYDTKPFDPSNITPPDCFALSLDGENMEPDLENVTAPQGRTCDTCPMNQWQPNPKRPGKNHKPCKERRRLALMPVDALKEGDLKKVEIAMMALPVTSVKNWASYVNQLASEYSRPPWAMMTEISVRPHPQNQFEVKFEAVAQVAEQYLGDVHSKIELAEQSLMVPYDKTGMMVPGDDPQKAPEVKPRKF